MPTFQRVSSSQIIKCINIARQYPKYYLPLLEQQINSFVNQYEYRINHDTICETNEGKDAWLLAKKFLQTQKPISPLIELSGLTQAAQNHALDLQKIDQITHSGSDGSTFVQRIIKYCQKSQGALVQIIGNDFDISERNHAEMMVLGLIIDDGVSSRGHRTSIFNPDYKYIGCGVGYLTGKIIGVLNMSQSKLKQKKVQGNVSTSTSNLGNVNTFKTIQTQKDQNLHQSKISERQSEKSMSSSVVSGRSHKSQKVWTFTKVQERSRKMVQQMGQTIEPRVANDSKISINNQKDKQNSSTSSKGYIESSSKIPKSKQSSNEPLSKSINENKDRFNMQSSFVGSDVTNTKDSPLLKTSKADQSKVMNNSGFISQGSSGFKRIKQKKQVSRIWQQGEFKFQQKTTQIKYTDGTEEQYKQKKSLLLDQTN